MNLMPTMETTFDWVRQACQKYRYPMYPSADDAAIEKLQQECKRRFGLHVPQRYCHLLRLADSIEYNGVRFFGTGTKRSLLNPEYVASNVPEETAMQWPWLPKLILGGIEDQYFCYDQDLDEYQTYIVGDREPYRRFPEFDAIFAHAFEGR